MLWRWRVKGGVLKGGELKVGRVKGGVLKMGVLKGRVDACTVLLHAMFFCKIVARWVYKTHA